MNLRQWIDKDQGVGDTLKKLTKAVGIKACKPCEKRAEKMNRLFPYRKETAK